MFDREMINGEAMVGEGVFVKFTQAKIIELKFKIHQVEILKSQRPMLLTIEIDDSADFSEILLDGHQPTSLPSPAPPPPRTALAHAH